MSKEVIIIGDYFRDGLKSFSWSSELPNLSDFDTIILDTTKITHGWLRTGRLKPFERYRYTLSKTDDWDERIKSNVRMIRQKLLEILEFDRVSVYALYCPNRRIHIKTKVISTSGTREELTPYMDTNDWCPISINITEESGRYILVKEESYRDYFQDFKGWKYYFVPDSLNYQAFANSHQANWRVLPSLNVIAENKVLKPLAIQFIPRFHRWTDNNRSNWHSSASKFGGRLTLLPVLDEYHTDSLIETLLKFDKVVEETPQPQWVSAIEIPGEALLKNELAKQKKQLENAEAKTKVTQDSLNELQKTKGLLYDTGITLQGLVKTTLEKLGAGIEPSTVTDEFVINIAGEKALVEVKGNIKSIAKRDLGQLITDLGEHLKATDEDIGGLLIGNAWRLEPLEARDTHDKPVFSQTVVKIAENRSIGLLSTTELFRAYCRVMEDPTRKEGILNKIIGDNGLIKF